MYQALYRKWRPRTFDDVVGQEHITTTLKHEVASGKFSHAYLFTGSRGTGKTTCSKIIAKAVNCLHPVDGNPCNQCDICRGIDDGSILDVAEIDAASNNGVDSIRQLREEAFFLPAVAKYRVYILDECHMLSAGAVNALLKILEEPPEHVLFILATTEVHKVLPTILSRCQRFDFKRISSQVIARRLLQVGEQEGFSLAEDAALLIGRLSDGGMRDALSLLDLCASYGPDITVQSVTEAAGLAGQEQIFALSDAILGGQPGQALQVVGQLSENSVDFSQLCEQLAGHFRDLMLVKTVKTPEDLVQSTPEELERLRQQAKGLSLGRILYALDVLQDTMGRLSRTSFKRTEFEMAVVRLGDEQLGQGLEGAYARIEKLERKFRSGVLAAPAAAQPADPPAVSVALPKAPPSKPAAGAAPTQKPAAAPQNREAVPFANWNKVLEELQKINPALYGAMVESRAFTSGDLMLVDCKNDLFLMLLRTSVAAKESLRSAILAVTGQKYHLGPFRSEKYTVSEQAAAADPLKGLLKRASELNVPVDITE
ncbi:MAG TPA: DNA polymerase III subunit gamma/tau [Candidatus Anaerotruncus excrementipullorum]|uniref:DNA-directed DNA polymerase n=1 Tax=Candidatus Anaerotruncus excrementipullorum TaxID=2838465 RepID=A0A9D2B7I4_9FIRM|nr:DNA polymerase III subunit gamma/tau [Candidatus Anaerotruncus excrementipullorum]